MSIGDLDIPTDKELLKQLDELGKDGPSKVITNIYEYELKHKKMMLKKYGRFVSQFEVYYDLLVRVLDSLNYIERSAWPKHRGVQFVLMVHQLKSLFSSFDRLISGYYEDSLILTRPVYEAFIKTIYVSCHRNEPYGVFERKFNLTSFVTKELAFDWSEYGILSSMTHANKYLVLQDLQKVSQGKQIEAITLKFKFDKVLCELEINYLIFLLAACLKFADEFFITSHNHVLTPEIAKKVKELLELRGLTLRTHPKAYWRLMAEDLDDIVLLMHRAEKVDDWKKEWREIRTKTLKLRLINILRTKIKA